MAIAQLFFRKGNFISEIELDIIITEGATATARVTKNPVEFGADMNDHVIIDPMSFNVAGVVSNASSNLLGQFGAAATALTSDLTKSQQAWEDLLELQANAQPFTLVQGLRSYDNVVISNLTESQDKDTSNALFFTATLTEINIPGLQPLDVDKYTDQDIEDSMAATSNSGLTQMGEI